MVRHGLLLTLLVGLLVGPGVLHLGACSVGEIATGTCSVDASAGPDEVTLSGSATGASGTGSSGGAGASHASGGDKAQPDVCETVVAGRCLVRNDRPAPAGPVIAAQPVTLRDIVAFRPAPGVQYMEPNGWVVPGLDANFYSVADQQLVNGTLLGQPATVRFTPVAWHWNYGDGNAAVRSTKGATWAALRLNDFDPTPTSHVYAAEGEYVIRLSIEFRAEYRFGGTGFVPIAGRITLPANDLHVTVTGAKTVLVQHDCTANSSGPGC